MTGPQASLLPDGRRLHLHHGPIDLIIEAFASEADVRRAYRAAARRFATILDELVAELPLLRQPIGPDRQRVHGAVARRMIAAVVPHAAHFITPMAAVAGSVAEEVLQALVAAGPIAKAYVNNGGDVALHLAHGEELSIAISQGDLELADRVVVRGSDPVRGIATSGWRGRSHSLGIADAVTVLAATASAADAAATLIANAVDLPAGSRGQAVIWRQPACELTPDSDLGARLVTIAVGHLDGAEVEMALAAGLARAERMRHDGMIVAAALFLAGQAVSCGDASGRSFELQQHVAQAPERVGRTRH